MFKHLKLSYKISLGFISILSIAIILGTIAIVNMTTSGSSAKILDQEYVPSVTLASELVSSANNIMLNIRGYGLVETPVYYENYKKEQENFEKIIVDFEKLGSEAKHIPELKGYVSEIKKSFEEYKTLVEETKKANETLEALRADMDKNAKLFMDNANSFYDNQFNKLNEEIKGNADNAALIERSGKIYDMGSIVDLGNTIRVTNFKSQSLRELPLLDQAISYFPKIIETLDKIKAITRQEANLKEIENVRDSGNAYKSSLESFKATWIARNTIGEARAKKSDEVLAALEKINSLGLSNTEKIAENTSTSLNLSTIIMVVGLIIAVLLGAVLSVVIISSITKSINQIVKSLRAGSEQVLQASEQLSSASQSLAEGSSEQAAAIEETSSTLDETSSMVQQNTENTKQASLLSNNAKEAAEKGNKEMADMMVAMAEIKESSNQISKIIKVIDDIAFQTNILALNAAVEAAGAGEAGMGFAVVAEEVRNLAQRSAQAAQDTAEMIETSIIRADKGAGIAEKVALSLNEIREQAKKVNEIMNEITTASQEQTQGIFQINKAVNQMEQVTQSIASGAEESASSSEELSAQAESLMEIVTDLVILVDGQDTKKTNNKAR